MDWRETIYTETMKKEGYLYQLGSDEINEAAYQRLLAAIKEGIGERKSNKITKFDEKDRLVVACLFEVPFMVENNVDHYSRQSEAVGERVVQMSDQLREVIHEFVWSGLQKYYQDLDY